MAKTNRKPTHEELQRDEIAEGLHDTIEQVYEHRYVYLVLIVLLVVAAFGVRYYFSSREQQLVALNQSLTEAMSSFGELETQVEAEPRREQATALVATLDELLAEHGTGEALGRVALYLKGMTHYSVDDFQAARNAYNQFIEAAEDDEERARGRIALAYAYENEGFLPAEAQAQRTLLDQAQTQYLQASGIAGEAHPYLYYYALLGQARIHEATGNNEEALALYRQVVEERPALTVEAPEVEAGDRQQQQMQAMLARMMREREEPLSLAATARLRLERLQARAGIAPAEGPVTTVIAP